jgi:serine/threonine protein phosphatase PrpC
VSKIIADSHYDIGGYRDVYEDRVNVKAIKTAGGLKLTVAAVADGVGGENKGERAAQTALDALYGYLEKSKERAIPTLLTQAVQYANKAVFQLQRETSGASTTLAVATVDESSSKLFIANVGDSRIYLCRKQKLTQLTIDHSWSTVMVWQGKVSPEAAQDHPRANVLMRALGPKDEVIVDLGFYVGTTDYEEANARGLEGLPLVDGDTVLVCSDGLIKDSPKTGKALITTEEIIRTVNEKEGKKAAQELVSFALGRGPDDNISVALIQMPDRWRFWRVRRPMLIAGAVILGLAVVLLLVIYFLTTSRQEVTTLRQEKTATEVARIIMSSYTPTPSSTSQASSTLTPSNTPTPSPSPTPSLTVQPSDVILQEILGTIEYADNPDGTYQSLDINVNVPIQKGFSIHTLADSKAKLLLSDGSFLYLGPETNLALEYLTEPTTGGNTVIRLDQGLLLVDSQGLTVNTQTGQSAAGNGILMGVSTNPNDMSFHVDCLEGNCTVNATDQVPTTLAEGEGIGVDWQIAPAECAAWKKLGGDRVPCVETPTPEATLTPTETPTGAPLATNVRIPTATDTEKPTKPKNTRTPVPATTVPPPPP